MQVATYINKSIHDVKMQFKETSADAGEGHKVLKQSKCVFLFQLKLTRAALSHEALRPGRQPQTLL